jgi:hypothetical protein
MSFLRAQAEKQFQLCAKFVSPSATILGNVNLQGKLEKFKFEGLLVEVRS